MRIVALDVGSSSVRAVAYDERGDAEPGDAHLAYDEHDADQLVDACRSVLAQVGDGDALAISCFWHSLVAVDAHDRPLTPVLTWRDVAGDPPPLDPVVRPRGLPPANRLLPAPRVLAREARPPRRGGRRRRALPLVRRLPAPAARRRGTHERLDRERHRPLRPEPPRVGRRDARRARPRRRAARARVRRAGRGRVAGARRRRVLERRRGLRRARAGRGDDRHLGRGARRLRTTPTLAPKAGLFLYRLDAARFCEGGALSDGGNLHAWLRRTLHEVDTSQIADRPAAGHGLTFQPFLGGERSLGWDPERRGAIGGLDLRDHAARHRAGRAGGRLLPAGRRARRDRRRRVGRRDRRRAARERGLAADPRRRDRDAGRGVGRARGIGARRRASSRSSGSGCGCPRRRSRGSSSRGSTATRSICG